MVIYFVISLLKGPVYTEHLRHVRNVASDITAIYITDRFLNTPNELLQNELQPEIPLDHHHCHNLDAGV